MFERFIEFEYSQAMRRVSLAISQSISLSGPLPIRAVIAFCSASENSFLLPCGTSFEISINSGDVNILASEAVALLLASLTKLGFDAEEDDITGSYVKITAPGSKDSEGVLVGVVYAPSINGFGVR